MNIEVYNGRDIQHFISLLNQAEGEGITDLWALRTHLSNRLHDIVLDHKVSMARIKKEKRQVERIHCPSCAEGYLVNRYVDGITYQACEKCRFSRLVNG